MIIIHDRNSLITYLENNLTHSVQRALLHHNELLGLFDPMIASRPGWIVRATSVTGRQYLSGVSPEQKRQYRVWQLDEVHWENWVGGLYESKLNNGDYPSSYYKLCETAKLLRDKGTENAG